MRKCALGLVLLVSGVQAQDVGQVPTPHPVLFVTQFPVAGDFVAIGSVFGNHQAQVHLSGRGGDLYIRYGDGSLRNLTREAGFGEPGELQGERSISVRDPHVHWSGTRAVFSMVIGAPAHFQQLASYWQLYEVSGFGAGETVRITKVANQPADYNNVMPVYASDDQIVFVSDRPRNGARHLYPQQDEYESAPTNTGLWKLDPASGALQLLQHSPSGSFDPLVDSFGRVLFTRWDHLQRDQQNDAGTFGTFNFNSEDADSVPTADRSEVFPEPRADSGNVNRFTINHFFPWQVHQDGSGEETLNHIGRHELHSFFNHSFTDDANLGDFISVTSGRTNANEAGNFLQLHEDPTHAGRYYTVMAPEFGTHNAGQIMFLDAPPAANPDDVVLEYVTHPDTRTTLATAGNDGHYRNPVVLSDGRIIASHTPNTEAAGNAGTRANPDPTYDFRLRQLVQDADPSTSGILVAGPALTGPAGLSRRVRFFDPDVEVTYDGPFWELGAVEVVARATPPVTVQDAAPPELDAYARSGVSEAEFRAFLRARNLAVVVMRDVTTRDDADEQQPYNLRVAVEGGRQTPSNPTGKVYDLTHMQFFQGDQIRGRNQVGRRVLAQPLHDEAALQANLSGSDGPTGSVRIAQDGSVAAFVPAGRAMAWQTTAPDGTPVVRERYWITFQPGEVRACDGCHGVNRLSHDGQPPSTQTAQAFVELLGRWRSAVFDDGFEAVDAALKHGASDSEPSKPRL